MDEPAKPLPDNAASKGGRARANVLTPEHRQDIARRAVRARWLKAGKVSGEVGSKDSDVDASNEKSGSITLDSIPHTLFSGTLTIGNTEMPCHVLSDGRRVLHQRAMVSALNMSRGGSAGEGGDRLLKFIQSKSISPHVSKRLREGTETPVVFRMSHGQLAKGYEATILADICDSVLAAEESGTLHSQQKHIARQSIVLIRAFARVGIVALIDEATGFQEARARHELQLKFHAFIADELQEWARMFTEEFWLELARLEGIRYSAHSRPLRWGRYIMMFVYDAIDPAIGAELRRKNPTPHFKANHHQWLKKFGRDKVTIQIEKVTTIMKLCRDMTEFREKFAHVFKKSPLQMTFGDVNPSFLPREKVSDAD